MRKIISFMVVFLIIGSIAIPSGMKNLVVPEKTSNKTVEFSIFSASSYSSPTYKKSRAKIVLTVKKLTGNNQDTLWQTTIDKGYLRNYPLAEESLYRKVTVFNIPERTANVVASYKVIYYNNTGAEFSYEQNYLVQDVAGNTLPITL